MFLEVCTVSVFVCGEILVLETGFMCLLNTLDFHYRISVWTTRLANLVWFDLFIFDTCHGDDGRMQIANCLTNQNRLISTTSFLYFWRFSDGNHTFLNVFVMLFDRAYRSQENLFVKQMFRNNAFEKPIVWPRISSLCDTCRHFNWPPAATSRNLS